MQRHVSIQLGRQLGGGMARPWHANGEVRVPSAFGSSVATCAFGHQLMLDARALAACRSWWMFTLEKVACPEPAFTSLSAAPSSVGPLMGNKLY